MEEVMFRDKVLICDECHNQFVFTVGQQRATYQEGGTVEMPRFCPVCSVKIERMGRQSIDTESAGIERETVMSTNGSHSRNGHSYTDASVEPYTNGAKPMTTLPEDDDAHPSSTPDDGQLLSEGDALPASPNRPADYRSGDEHPLYGHGGETYLGSVKWFNDRKGFGFITLDNGLEIFVHYSGIAGDGYKTLKQGQRVSILVEDTGKGPQASQVMVVAEAESEDASLEA